MRFSVSRQYAHIISGRSTPTHRSTFISGRCPEMYYPFSRKNICTPETIFFGGSATLRSPLLFAPTHQNPLENLRYSLPPRSRYMVGNKHWVWYNVTSSTIGVSNTLLRRGDRDEIALHRYSTTLQYYYGFTWSLCRRIIPRRYQS